MSLEKAVENMLSEHYKSYVLVAYDYDGNRMVFTNIKNQEERDSLTLAMDKAYADVSEDFNGCDFDEDFE